MHGNGQVRWPVVEVLAPLGHALQPRRREALVEVHHPARGRSPDLGQLRGVGGRGAHENGVIAPRFRLRQPLGLFERCNVHDGGIRVGHGADHREASSEGSSGARIPVLLVAVTRLAQVAVRVDEARELHDSVRRHAVDDRVDRDLPCVLRDAVRQGLQAAPPQRLDEKFAALDVRDERDRVVDGSPACQVSLRHKRGRRVRLVSHRQVDDEIHLARLEKLSHRHLRGVLRVVNLGRSSRHLCVRPFH